MVGRGRGEKEMYVTTIPRNDSMQLQYDLIALIHVGLIYVNNLHVCKTKINCPNLLKLLLVRFRLVTNLPILHLFTMERI